MRWLNELKKAGVMRKLHPKTHPYWFLKDYHLLFLAAMAIIVILFGTR
jgi:hypothetical protein